jgi:hypothetical protein
MLGTRRRRAGTIIVGGLAGTLLSGCMQRVPITTEAMPGSDVRVVSVAGMVVLDAPQLRDPVDVGCRVTEVEGRVERLAGDSAFVRPLTWWRAESGKRQACERVGNAAVVLLPDSAAREVNAIRTDRKRTGWLVGSIVGTVVVVVTVTALLLAALLGGFN